MTLILTVLQSRKDMENEPFVFVINEAHTYFSPGISKDFVDSLRNMIRRKRHGNNWLLLDTQLPEDLDEQVMRLADVKIMHYLGTVKQGSSEIIRDLGEFAQRIHELHPGQCIIAADDSSEGRKPIEVDIRPRLTKHGGAGRI